MSIPDDTSAARPEAGAQPVSPIPPPMPANSYTAPVAERPASIIVIAILFFIGSLTEFFELFLRNQHMGATVIVISSVVKVFFCVVLLLVGIGLLQLRAIARTGAIATLILRFVTYFPLFSLGLIVHIDTYGIHCLQSSC